MDSWSSPCISSTMLHSELCGEMFAGVIKDPIIRMGGDDEREPNYEGNNDSSYNRWRRYSPCCSSMSTTTVEEHAFPYIISDVSHHLLHDQQQQQLDIDDDAANIHNHNNTNLQYCFNSSTQHLDDPSSSSSSLTHQSAAASPFITFAASSTLDDQTGFLHPSGSEDQSDNNNNNNNNNSNCRNGVPKSIRMGGQPTRNPSSASGNIRNKAPATVNQAQQVRKLGQRISALQQLVSPFGKTDTASVLSEAIGYIKFLQEQVHVLSSPYMVASSNGEEKECESVSDLRSRGLCLVPISCCTENVANNNNGADYWISSIAGTCNHY